MAKPKSLITELTELRTAALKLYYAGAWKREGSKESKMDAQLWEGLRDALRLPPGTSPKA